MTHDYAKLAEDLLRNAAMNEEIPVKTHLHDTAILERRAAAALARAGEMEKALRAMVESVDKYVIATDDVDVRGAMCLARAALRDGKGEE